MKHYNKAYHKNFRSGERGKHLRPYLKRTGNKSFRKTASDLENEFEREIPRYKKRKLGKRSIKIRITKSHFGSKPYSHIYSYRTMRDAENAINQNSVVRAEFIRKD